MTHPGGRVTESMHPSLVPRSRAGQKPVLAHMAGLRFNKIWECLLVMPSSLHRNKAAKRPARPGRQGPGWPANCAQLQKALVLVFLLVDALSL